MFLFRGTRETKDILLPHDIRKKQRSGVVFSLSIEKNKIFRFEVIKFTLKWKTFTKKSKIKFE